jgi:hypothetical protein
MAINDALRRFSRSARGPRATRSQEPIAIGEMDAQTFNCPKCARPLGIGASVCPGCGTRLILGVKARAATGFMVFGLAAGALLTGAYAYVGQTAAPGSIGAGAGAGTSGSNGTGTSATATPVMPADIGIPSKAVSALRQAAILDARLRAQSADLRVLLRSRGSQGIDYARVLRSVNSDATFGVDLAPSIAQWHEAAKLSNDLGSFYRAVRDSALSSLTRSVSDTAAYRNAGKRMYTLLAKLPALDATAEALVTAAGLTPLVEPDPTPTVAP